MSRTGRVREKKDLRNRHLPVAIFSIHALPPSFEVLLLSRGVRYAGMDQLATQKPDLTRNLFQSRSDQSTLFKYG